MGQQKATVTIEYHNKVVKEAIRTAIYACSLDGYFVEHIIDDVTGATTKDESLLVSFILPRILRILEDGQWHCGYNDQFHVTSQMCHECRTIYYSWNKPNCHCGVAR